MKSSRRSVSNITINRLPSRQLAILLGAVYGAAIVSSFLLAILMNPFFYALAVFLIMHFALVITGHVLPGRRASVVTLRRESDGGWILVRADKTVETGFLRPHSFISRYITVLVFSEPWRWLNTSIVVMPDSVGRDQYRQLLVLLRTTAIMGDIAV